MAVDPIAAVRQGQQLDLLAAQQVPAGGPIEPLEGPAVPDESFQVAGWATPLGKALGHLFDPLGGRLEGVRQRVGEQRQLEPGDPPPAALSPLGPEVPPAAAPEVRVPTDEVPRAPGVVPESAAVDPAAFTLSPAALEARVLNQSNPIRIGEVEADATLKALLDPHYVEELVSDGLTDFTARGARDVIIPDEGKIYAIIEHISQANRLEIDDATRKVITHEVSQELADYLGMTPEKLMAAVMNMRRTGGVPIVEGAGVSETIMAVRNLLYSEVSKLDELVDGALLSTGSSEDLLNFRQQFEVVSNLLANYKGIQTEIGRSLSIFRRPVDHAHPALRSVNLASMLDEFGGAGDIKKLALAYQKLPTGRQRVQFTTVSKFKRFTDAAFEVWINNLLSGPISHTKNFVAAGITIFMETPVHLTAAGIGAARRALGGVGGATLGDVHAMFFGQMMSHWAAWGAAARAFRTGIQEVEGSKLEITLQPHAFSASAIGIPRTTRTGNAFAVAVDVLGSVATLGRVSTRALGAEDTYWKTVARNGNLWQQAFRGAKQQGLEGDAAAQFMIDFMVNPPVSAIKEADELARLLTLQQPLEGKLGEWVQRGARLGAMRWFMPFVKTPYNSFSFAFEHTPLAVGTRNFQETMRSGTPAQKDVAFARIALGTSAAIAVGFAAASSQITGGGPQDPGLRASLRRKGWQPYSILINGTYYSYAGGEPYSTIVGVMADAVELVQTGLLDQDDEDELLVGVVYAISKNLSNKNFMEGFSNFMNLITNGERYGEQIARSFTRTIVPVLGSGLLRQTAKSRDPYLRDPIEFESMPSVFADLPIEMQQENSEVLARYDSWAWLNSRIGELRANLPGLSKDVPALRDFWGRKVVNQGAWGPEPMSPIFMSVADDTEMVIDGKTYDTGVLDDEMIRLKLSYTEHPSDIAGFPMNAAERDFFQERAGKHAVRYMAMAFNSGSYQALRQKGVSQKVGTEVNQQLRAILQKTIRMARQHALQDLRNDQGAEGRPALGHDFSKSERQFLILQEQVTRQSVYSGVN